MQLSISSDEIAVSPEPVRDWFASKLGLTLPPVKPTEPEPEPDTPESSLVLKKPTKKTKPVEEPKAEAGPPTVEEVLQRAVALIESSGEEALKTILEKLGVASVRKCPDEKRAALLAEIATHA